VGTSVTMQKDQQLYFRSVQPITTLPHPKRNIASHQHFDREP